MCLFTLHYVKYSTFQGKLQRSYRGAIVIIGAIGAIIVPIVTIVAIVTIDGGYSDYR